MLLPITLLSISLWILDVRFNTGLAKRPVGFSRDRLFITSPVHITVIVYVTFHYCWHTFWLMVALPETGSIYWHTPVVSFATLAQIERLVLVAMILLVATGFWFRDCQSVRYRVADCLLAATEITILGMATLAMPPNAG